MSAYDCCTILIPVKAFRMAKSRLSPVLRDHARYALARDLASRSIRAATAARAVERVLVLTSCADAGTLARALGAAVIADRHADFNALVKATARDLSCGGSRRVCYLAADLPRISARSIERFLATGDSDVRLARAARDGGTNALAMRDWDSFPCQFGTDSAFRHADAAAQLGWSVTIVERGPLAADLDVPADLDLIGRDTSRRQGYPRDRRSPGRASAGAHA